MFCSKCGKEMPDDAVLCTGCGCLLHKKEAPQTVNHGATDEESRVQNENFTAHVSADSAEKKLQKKAALFFLISLAFLCVSRIMILYINYRYILSSSLNLYFLEPSVTLDLRPFAIPFAVAAIATGIPSLFFGIKQKGSITLRLLTISVVSVSFTWFVISILSIL